MSTVTMIRLKPEPVLSLSTEQARAAVGGEAAFDELVRNYGLKPWRGKYAKGMNGNKGVMWSIASIQKAMDLAEATNPANG